MPCAMAQGCTADHRRGTRRLIKEMPGYRDLTLTCEYDRSPHEMAVADSTGNCRTARCTTPFAAHDYSPVEQAVKDSGQQRPPSAQPVPNDPRSSRPAQSTKKSPGQSNSNRIATAPVGWRVCRSGDEVEPHWP